MRKPISIGLAFFLYCMPFATLVGHPAKAYTSELGPNTIAYEDKATLKYAKSAKSERPNPSSQRTKSYLTGESVKEIRACVTRAPQNFFDGITFGPIDWIHGETTTNKMTVHPPRVLIPHDNMVFVIVRLTVSPSEKIKISRTDVTFINEAGNNIDIYHQISLLSNNGFLPPMWTNGLNFPHTIEKGESYYMYFLYSAKHTTLKHTQLKVADKAFLIDQYEVMNDY